MRYFCVRLHRRIPTAGIEPDQAVKEGHSGCCYLIILPHGSSTNSLTPVQ